MKNIGIFTHDLYPFKPWGQGRYVYDLARRLRTLFGGEIYVFSPSDNIKDDRHIRIFGNSHNTFGKNITFSIKLAFSIKRLIETYNLGTVHFQGGPGGLFLLAKPSVPLIYTVHHTYYQQSHYIRSQKWKKILCLWERFGYQKSDYLLCDSASTMKIILRHYHLKPNCCETIPIGVDESRFHPLGLERIPNSMFFLGRLDSRKGIDFLIKSIPLIKDRLDDIRLYIGGEGVLRHYLERFIKNNHLENTVHLLGTIDDSMLNEWYNKVSVVVIPSVFEGFGLTAIEAMACRTPVIATDTDGLRDVIEDGINGLLVKYNDVKMLSEKIVYLMKNEPERIKLSKNGKERVRTVFNWDIISQDILKVYEFILKNKP
ncbi:MAG: glycosyltransferase family 4 protein [Desulfobacterales bacterium]|nr:glycosyltransferase family 4 protein [Desulfobacterales bacterium]